MGLVSWELRGNETGKRKTRIKLSRQAPAGGGERIVNQHMYTIMDAGFEVSTVIRVFVVRYYCSMCELEQLSRYAGEGDEF